MRTHQGRGVLRSGGVGLAVKVAGLLISFASMPAYLEYFAQSSAKLGAWFMLLSLLTWALNLDLGIGNGLRQRAVPLIAQGDRARLTVLVSSSYAFSTALALLASLIGVLAVSRTELTFLGGPGLSKEFAGAIVVLLLALTGQMVLRLATSILYALQRPVIPAVLTLVSNCLLLGFLLGANYHGTTGDVVKLSLAYLVAINVPLLGATVWLFLVPMRGIRPRIKSVRRNEGLATLKVGVGFLSLQLMFMGLTTSNPILLGYLIDLDSVVEYQVYSRPYVSMALLFSLALSPIWSAVTKAVHEHDSNWVTQLSRNLALMVAGCAAFILFMTPFMQPLFNLWLGAHAFALNQWLLVVCGVSSICLMANAAVSSIANGAGLIRSQLWLLAAGLALKALFAIMAAQVSRGWGLVILSDVVGFAPYLLIQPVLIARYFHATRPEAASAHM